MHARWGGPSNAQALGKLGVYSAAGGLRIEHVSGNWWHFTRAPGPTSMCIEKQHTQKWETRDDLNHAGFRRNCTWTQTLCSRAHAAFAGRNLQTWRLNKFQGGAVATWPRDLKCMAKCISSGLRWNALEQCRASAVDLWCTWAAQW